MKVVRHISTGRLVYRQIPDFEAGFGIKNASIIREYPENALEEIEVTEPEWDAELALREQERPRTAMEVIEANIDTSGGQRAAFKLSELYGLTQGQLETYIENNVTTLATAKEYLEKLSAVVLWLVKQNKLDQ